MPQAPVADQRRLLDVQSLDTHLTQLRHKRNTLEVLATITELQSRLEDTATALAHSRTRASDLTRELTKAEDDVTQVTTRLTRNQQRLDTGAVSAKDAQALMHEITSSPHAKPNSKTSKSTSWNALKHTKKRWAQWKTPTLN